MKSLIKNALILDLSVLIIFVFITGCQQQKDYSKEYKPILDKLVDAWNGSSLDSLDALFDAKYVRSVNDQPDVFGVESCKKAITNLRTAYPDLKLTVDHEIFSENSAAVRWVITGTNTGPGVIPPTGKAVKFWGITIFNFADGKITHEFVANDDRALMEQLGYTITPPAVSKKK